MGMDTCTGFVAFLLMFSRRYCFETIKIKSKEFDTNAKELLSYLQSNCNYTVGERIDGSAYRNNAVVYDLIKKTWVGYRIYTLATLQETINRKLRDSDIDLSELLIE